MIAELAGVLLPVFCVAAVGYAWRRSGAAFDLDFVTRLMLNIAAPCLVFDSLWRMTLPLGDLLAMAGAAAALLAIMVVASFALLRLLELPVRSYLPSVAIGNTGNLGLPLSLFAFGEIGLSLAVAVFVTNSLGQFVLTPLLQARTSLLRTIVTTPVIYGAALGALAFATEAELPEWLATTIGLFADVMIPLMLLALGYTLGGLKARNFKLAVGLAGARLVLSIAAVTVVILAFQLEGVALGVMLLQGVMPTAVFSYLFAARYARAADDVAGIVLVSTLLTAALLPLLVSLALKLAAP
jgi:predicted permease